jgi:tetratricopeptide (TPR) repeat protein
MNSSAHPNEDLLFRFASGDRTLADSAAIQNHILSCAECHDFVESARQLEDAFRTRRTWRGAGEAATLQRQIADFHQRLQREDREALVLLKDALESEYTFHYENVASKVRYRTGGVVRVLVKHATSECEREPLYALSLAESARSIADALPDDYYPGNRIAELRGDASMALANAYRYLARFDDGMSVLSEAEAAFNTLPAPGPRLVRVLNGRAALLFQQQQYEEAHGLAQRAARAAASYGETVDYRTALQIIAVVHVRTDRHTEARAIFAKLYQIAQKSGDPELEARAAMNLGSCHWEMGDFANAGQLLLGAKRIFEELDRPTEALRASWSIAALAIATGKADAAVPELRRIIAEAESRGMVSDGACAQLDLAEALFILKQFDEVVQITEPLIDYFVAAGMAKGAVKAATFLRDATRARRLTRQTIQFVRAYLRRLELTPELPFEPPPADPGDHDG